MAMIRGRGGRMYDTATGKRVETVEHPEMRTPEQLRAARAAAQPKQPPRFAGNPFEQTIEMELKRHNHLWAGTVEGQRVLGTLRRASAEWEAERKAKADAAEFAESVRPLVEHAEQQVQTVFDDSSYSVEDVEQAEAALAAAREGRRSDYIAWEQSHHSKLLDKLAAQAAGADGVAREAAERRDAILKSGINYKPAPIPEIGQPQATIPVDRSRVAITRKVPTESGGYREVTEIVDAE